MKEPGFDLDWPGTLVFSPELALRGHALNRFALSLRSSVQRERFLADERAYMTDLGLQPTQQDAVLARDWTALLQAGGHLQAILKVAATVGQGLWHIGAHHAQVEVAVLQATCPRKVAALPGQGAV